MVNSFNSLNFHPTFVHPPLDLPVIRIVEEVKEIKACAQEAVRSLYDLASDPIEMALGGLWATCVAASAYSLIESACDLYTALAFEALPSEPFGKVGLAVNRAFCDLLSFVSSCAYSLHWAHEVMLISLGALAPLVLGLSFGGTLILSSIESGAMVHLINTEIEAIGKAPSPAERENHKQLLCLSLMRLVAKVSMLAWAALSIGAIVTGGALSQFVLLPILGLSSVCSTAAFFYENHLKNNPSVPATPALK